ncbi:hypothetical protein, partial [Bosea sp. Tri-44]|uniref:hypothetical protein n=1 Tax=Bosea sp. Tri-44 TaxID=1972137 RepID=UPI0019D6E127
VDGSAGEDPGSPTGLLSLRVVGLPPATAPASVADEAKSELQGVRTENVGLNPTAGLAIAKLV